MSAPDCTLASAPPSAECAHVVARHAAERITQMGALELMRMVAYW